MARSAPRRASAHPSRLLLLLPAAASAAALGLGTAAGASGEPPAGSCAAGADCGAVGGDGDSLLQLRNDGGRAARAPQQLARASGPISKRCEETIKADLHHPAKPPAEGPECTMVGPESCPLKALTAEPTLIFPGGETSCLDGSKYGFLVWPGAKDKLLIWFQDGGVCFGPPTDFDNILCTTNLAFATFFGDYSQFGGIFNRTNPHNPYRDYTLVAVLYCSGDLFLGNISFPPQIPAPPPGPGPVQQKGFFNARAAVDWARTNFPGALDSFVVSGTSAGALGTQVWAGTLLREFKYRPHAGGAAVLMDGFLGAFPPGTQGPLFIFFNACGTGVIPQELLLRCATGQLDIPAVLNATMPGFPRVPFAHIHSKYDSVQMSFYSLLAMNANLPPLDPAVPDDQNQFYALANDLLGSLNENDNFVTYLVNSVQHQTLYREAAFTTTSVCGTGVPCDQPSLVDFLSQFPFRLFRKTAHSQCLGELLDPPFDGAPAPSCTFTPPLTCAPSYCSTEVIPKKYKRPCGQR